MHLRALTFAVPLVLSALTAAPSVEAFCGFYVAGADKPIPDKPGF